MKDMRNKTTIIRTLSILIGVIEIVTTIIIILHLYKINSFENITITKVKIIYTVNLIIETLLSTVHTNRKSILQQISIKLSIINIATYIVINTVSTLIK